MRHLSVSLSPSKSDHTCSMPGDIRRSLSLRSYGPRGTSCPASHHEESLVFFRGLQLLLQPHWLNERTLKELQHNLSKLKLTLAYRRARSEIVIENQVDDDCFLEPKESQVHIVWVVSVILLLFELSLASNCDSFASAFQEQGLQAAHVTTRVSTSLLCLLPPGCRFHCCVVSMFSLSLC